MASNLADRADLIAEAGRLGLRIGCAPDTFLGDSFQAGRALLDAGAIGEPLSVSAACSSKWAGELAPQSGHLLHGQYRPAARHGPAT